jgi:MerR family transcriptional regulator, light-induced transcriptional regulator
VSVYSIKDLEHLSGIKAHTLRIWEQRYNFISPKRTETNIRFYDDKDLKLVLNISLLKDNGFRISRIADMSEKEMQDEVLRLTERHLRHPDHIHSLTLAMVDLDEDRFDKIVNTCTLQMGFENTMVNVVYPFLSRIGVLWQTGAINPAHEHFISNLIRQKLMVAIDGQYPTTDSSSKKFLLFLPEGELHELSLLFSYYLIKARNHKTIYLGQNMPMADLEVVSDVHKPNYLVTVITSVPNHDFVEEYVTKLCKKFPNVTLLLSGFQVVGYDHKFPENVIILPNINRFIEFIGKNQLQEV